MKKYGKRRYKKKTYRKRKTSFKRRSYKKGYDSTHKVKFTSVNNVITANVIGVQSSNLYWWWGKHVVGGANNISYNVAAENNRYFELFSYWRIRGVKMEYFLENF